MLSGALLPADGIHLSLEIKTPLILAGWCQKIILETDFPLFVDLCLFSGTDGPYRAYGLGGYFLLPLLILEALYFL